MIGWVVAAALLVAGLWWARQRKPVVPDATVYEVRVLEQGTLVDTHRDTQKRRATRTARRLVRQRVTLRTTHAKVYEVLYARGKVIDRALIYQCHADAGSPKVHVDEL